MIVGGSDGSTISKATSIIDFESEKVVSSNEFPIELSCSHLIHR